jgi:hypothetical protein
MPKVSRNFIAGRMNKVVDERLLPEGEYIDAMNIRMGSTEKSEIGVIENTTGNSPLTKLAYLNTQLSTDAVCIGSIADAARETIYWFVHDSNFPLGATGKIDLIVSYNVLSDILTYHNGSGPQKVVEYNSETGYYRCKFQTGGGFIDTLFYYIERGCEIIGNIYENKNLLK